DAARDVVDVVVDAEGLLHHDDAALRPPGRFVDRQRSLLTHARDSTPGSRRPSPRAKRRRRRHTPLRSSRAVVTRSTRESGSSTQSTSTSWIRSPLCSASTSSSVSKNQASSSTRGSNARATSARTALKPHWASEKPLPSVALSSRL